MRKLHQQVKARDDIKKIWNYSFKEHGEAQADKYYDELIVGMNAIQNNLNIGVACDYIRLGYRQYQVHKHFIFYRLSDKQIYIVRVLHKRMIAKGHL